MKTNPYRLFIIYISLFVTGCSTVSRGAFNMDCLDYNHSFIGSTGPGNVPRFQVESRTRIIDEKNGTSEDFYQCASCKSEYTFAAKNLFQADNFDFMPVFGSKDTLIFRRKSYLNTDYRTISPSEQLWGGPVFQTRKATSRTLLKNNTEIQRATLRGMLIISQIEIWDEHTGLRAIIECPVRTMNIDKALKLYQVDTGPILWPDLSQRYGRAIDSLSLAFVAFNSPDFADFIIEAPTPIKKDNNEILVVYHYSVIKSFVAKNRIYCIGKLDI